ncbi:MAG: TMEM165/GDT1 family protein [Gammaproteobacteria bacterium]|nr:TMEM165/GDT1 family protein [Gammaproteobacteria bacterium]MDH5802872.1 TMEM165/GDT1 family protein [Gammaproteobacteria bacterium]
MDLKLFSTVFVTVFLAEIADKTQLATMLFASNAQNAKLLVFAAAALALVVATAVAVFAGALLSQSIDEKLMARIAGVIFIVIGLWTLVKA